MPESMAAFLASEASANASLATGIAELDAVLPGGGLPRGALIEISGAPSSGKTSLALALLAAVQTSGGAVAAVDPRGAVHAPALAAAGVDLAHLLVVRPPLGDRHAPLRAVDHLLTCRGFACVALDLAGAAEPPPLDRLFRVARIAKAAECIVLALTENPPEAPSLGSPVSLRLCVRRTGFHFGPRATPPFFLAGERIAVAVRKSKYGAPGGTANLRLEVPA